MPNVTLTIGAIFNGKAIKTALKELGKFAFVSKKNTATIKNNSKKQESAFKRVGQAARRAASEMNKVLGGKGTNMMGGANSLGQNISSISNRLGFMAFQWNFMANAANRAVDVVLGGLTRIIMKGAETNDAIIRAMAFSTPAQELRNFTDVAIADLSRMQDLIRELGSGQGIFGRDVVAAVAEQIQKAADDLEGTEIILPFALRIKTLDPSINDERLATGVISGLKALGVNIRDQKEVAKAFDLIANIADKTTANFQSTIASFAKAAPVAKALGFSATETALALQISFDTLARNKSSGRAGQSAGIIFQSFTRDLKELAVEGSKAQRFFAANDIIAFETGKDGRKNLKPLVPLIQEFGRALEPLDDQARAAFLELSGFEALSQDFILAAIQDKDNLQAMQDAFKERGTLATREAAVMASGLNQIKRITAAVDALKATFVEGFRPVLFQIAQIISGFAGDNELLKFIQDIGKFMAEDLKPVLLFIVKQFKLFFGLLRKNKKTLKFLTRSVLVLVGALAGLAILATVAFFALVAAGSFFGMGGQALLAAGGMRKLALATLGTLRSLLPLIFVGLGFGLIALALSGVLEDELVPAVLSLGAAISILSTAMLLGPVRLKAIAAAAALIPARLAAAGGSMVLFARLIPTIGVGAGQGLVSGLSKGLTRIPGLAMGAIRALASAGPIGIAIAAGAVIITAFIAAMNKEVEESTFFKSGLSDRWQQVGFRMTAATNVFLRNMVKALISFGEAFQKVFADIGGFVNAILDAIGDAWNAFWDGGFEAAIEAFKEGVAKAFGDFELGQTITAVFDLTGVSGAEQEIRNVLKTFADAGLTRFDDQVVNSFAEVLDAFEVEAGFFDSQKVEDLLNEFFPGQTPGSSLGTDAAEVAGFQKSLVDPELAESINAEAQAQLDALEELNPILLKDALTYAEINKLLQEQVKTNTDNVKVINGVNVATGNLKTQTEGVNKALTTTKFSLQNNIDSRDINSTKVKADSDTVQTDIDILSKNIIAIARNTNKFVEFSVVIEQAKLAFLKLALEGTEAARRISTLTVSKKGNFSMSGRQTTTTFDELPSLQINAADQFFKVVEAFGTLGNLINIGELQGFLSAISEEAKKVANDTGNIVNFQEKDEEGNDIMQPLASTGSFLDDFDFFLADLNRQLDPRLFGGDRTFTQDGQNINITVGGSFDIEITQDLSAEEVAELIQEKVKNELQEIEILKALKLTS